MIYMFVSGNKVIIFTLHLSLFRKSELHLFLCISTYNCDVMNSFLVRLEVPNCAVYFDFLKCMDFNVKVGFES